jgi:hypothetical protein
LQEDDSLSKDSAGLEGAPYLFIFLGASNLARGYTALEKCLVRCLVPHPVEILHAMGPGRGYCAEGGWLNIRYPSIGSSGILEAARERAQKAQQVTALITDIGNDIMYGVPVSEITACLNTLFKKFDAIDAEVFVNPIPLDFSKDVSKCQFRLLRSVFYPHSAIDYGGARQAVDAINKFLRDSADGRIHLLPSAKDFCGVDKIHYSVFLGHKAWSLVATEMLSSLPAKQAGKIGWSSTLHSLFANMGHLFFCDMFSVRKKPSGNF